MSTIETPQIDISRSVWRNPVHFIACGFCTWLLPMMPGTFATVAGVVLFFMLVKLPFIIHLIIVILLQIAGVWLCGRTNQDFGTDDHPAASYDEVAGFQIVMLGIPATWYYVIIGFALFRLFDIWKPGPIGWIDRKVHGGVGVMLDDIVAALAAWAILMCIVQLG